MLSVGGVAVASNFSACYPHPHFEAGLLHNRSPPLEPAEARVGLLLHEFGQGSKDNLTSTWLNQDGV